ncbi:MAG: M20 family metallopeptidase [Clostridiaceae bacterium]|nr:M20 family metallopeptidase [Clostridiaceae bacterium]
MDTDLILKQIESLTDEVLISWKKDLSSLIAKKSVRDLTTATLNAPFGAGIRGAFDVFREIAERLGFQVKDHSGYAIDAEISGTGQHFNTSKPAGSNGAESYDYIAVLGHLDVVPANESADWLSDPFTLTERDGYLYGRGVNDDKGPLLLCLYAAYLLQQIGFEFKLPLRIIAGGAEETTWECVDYYFKHNQQPLAAFSPDGNFPIINHELGILDIGLEFPPLPVSNSNCLIKQISSPVPEHKVCSEVQLILASEDNQITESLDFVGKSALSRNPHRGINAIDLMMDYLQNVSLDECGLLKFYQEFSCELKKKNLEYFTYAATSITYNTEQAKLYLDIRYPQGFDAEMFMQNLSEKLALDGANYKIERHLKPLYVKPESPLIKILSESYEKVIGSPIGDVQAKGAASYARALKNGVNFGPTFPGEEPGSHFPNEHFSLDSAKKLLKIYALSIAALTNLVK